VFQSNVILFLRVGDAVMSSFFVNVTSLLREKIFTCHQALMQVRSAPVHGWTVPRKAGTTEQCCVVSQ
jgi:hypothetical protein